MEEKGAEVKDIINKAEISLILDTYDDIFSDFDPRPYSERALSEDFLIEARKRARDKKEGVELRFLIPKTLRNTVDEELIKQRLRGHFRKHYRLIGEDFVKRDKLAASLIAFGMVVGIVDALLLSYGAFGAIVNGAIEITFTITSWYAIWTGLDRLIFKPKDDISERAFYKKMEDAKISFTPY